MKHDNIQKKKKSIFENAAMMYENKNTIVKSLSYVSRSRRLRAEYDTQYSDCAGMWVPITIIQDVLSPWMQNYTLYFCTSTESHTGVILTVENGNVVWLDSTAGPIIPPGLRELLPREATISSVRERKPLSVLYPTGSIVLIGGASVYSEIQYCSWEEMERRFWIAAFNAKYNCAWNCFFGPFPWLC